MQRAGPLVSLLPWLVSGLVVATAACDSSTTVVRQGLSAEVRRERLGLIRDAAAEMGVTNAALLAGIAESETGLAHCFSEAGFGCAGPASSSCGGASVIAGGADGPCSALQGGLGMFQFDAGTHADTVATYGAPILTVEGNTAQAVAFVIDKVMLDVAGVDDWRAAAAWMNAVPLVAGDPLTEEWARLIACRYNGCCTTSTTCTTRARRYRDNAIAAAQELGAEFWRTADRCAAIPEGGIIDQRTECHVAGGEPRFWRREAAGHGGDREWTKSTAAATASSFAMWIVKAPRAGTYRVDAYVGGGAATTARYQITHAGTTDTIVVDQAASDGFVTLGDFAFAGAGDESVLLGDNTGTGDQKLVVDAVRIRSLEDAAAELDSGCGCAAPGEPAGFAALGLLALALRGRRRRRRQTDPA
ncbi:MAG: MYXO-CTERM sorting domain-containing protein [Myxococcota bacterium]|nr:MYXO-CTERM sorting domain-containing protein [Myxococcota bacterium]